MCNLSKGLIEQGFEQGAEQATANYIQVLLGKGKTPEEIHDLLDISPEIIQKVQATTTIQKTEA